MQFLGQELQILKDHVAEVITAKFSKDGNLVLTGSFDETAIIWDLRAKEYAVDFYVLLLVILYLKFFLLTDILLFSADMRLN